MASTTTLLVNIKTSDLMLFEGLLKKFKATSEIISKAENQQMDEIPKYIVQGIEQGIEEINQGKGILSQEVHNKARLLCSMQ